MDVWPADPASGWAAAPDAVRPLTRLRLVPRVESVADVGRDHAWLQRTVTWGAPIFWVVLALSPLTIGPEPGCIVYRAISATRAVRRGRRWWLHRPGPPCRNAEVTRIAPPSHRRRKAPS